ncbi:SusC/RagA family TonB-linked outer membrane protein [Flavitalea sp. BT771]|uniref:SusC/RagA family TonB-linked outer membrane protein n=1 Tax=Flavitalea sp. BT771 TaxID=3063329 RepID=UPI0026E3FAEC|nr:SusC/RagA family TonB-linked outer membrane protein [Flavitalea sp. BT771]MDO6432508.1 SusC/RagA family TonB-linked outer membrane protein [Flavitalea sp. BT771]MDV6221417.1 SusC/RagA family TonB-linked outer membrane protein [Flavitalea sp. BT771]
MRKVRLLLLGLLTTCCIHVMGQSVTITGKVIDSIGHGLPGASVRVKNTSTGTSTGNDGSFSLSASPGAILSVSAIGFRTQEIPVGNGHFLEIRLLAVPHAMEEVVVTALGVKREKRNLTFSSQEVKGDELVRAKEPSLVNAMAGKVAGVQITSSSGTPGASSRIVIRGASSPTGDNQALFVVDGVPINNDETGNIGGGAAGAGVSRIVDIDPAVIENINVLKGAAATALYGSAGARGVVLITTKAGGIDRKPVISLSSDLSFDKGLFPQRQWKYGQGSGGKFLNGETSAQKTSMSWGPLMDTLKINGVKAPTYNPYSSFFRTGVTTNSTASVSGGGNNSGYYMSYSYLDQKGIVPVNELKRHSFFFKYNARVGQKLNTTFQIGYSNSVQDRLPEGQSNGPLYVLLVQPISWNPYPILNPDGSQRLYRNSRNPPLWDLDNVKNVSQVNRFIPVFTASYTPASWLTVTERVGADIYLEQDKYTESPSPAISLKGQVLDQNINFRQFNHDLIVSAVKDFGKFHVNLLIGNNLLSSYNQSVNIKGVGITVDNFNNVSATSSISATEAHYQTRKVGFYSQANIEYNRFLVLSLTGRLDGSSVLASNKQFYPYGSAAAGFIFSELLPDQLRSAISFAKVRISYATVGNEGIGAYSLLTPFTNQYRNGNAFPFQGQSGFLLSSTLGNPTLQNERLNEIEGGLEAKFLDNRIGFEGSYFYRKTNHGIIPGVSISAATGYNGTAVNTASIQNKGLELLFTATPVRTRDLSWDLTLNFTRIRNKVLALYPGLDQLGRVIVGQPFNVFYGPRYLRDSASGQLMIDANGKPVVDDKQGVVGDPNPDWLAGITNNVRYKRFSLSFFFDYKKGGDVANEVEGLAFFYGTAKVTENRQPLIIKGISIVDHKPNQVAVDAQAYYTTRQYESSIQDGTYLKLRNVTLTYDIHPSVLGKTPVKAASLSVSGRNLWIYSPHFTGADPEVGSYGSGNGVQGIYSFSTPTTRSFNVTLKCSF